MDKKIDLVLENFTEIYKQDNLILPPNPKTLGNFEPTLDNLKRDNLEIVNQLQDDGSLDGGDSAHRSGVLAFCNSKKDQNLLNLFESDGLMVRHPKQIPWNNWKNCSRDQLFGFIAGCWRSNQNEIVQRLFEKHEKRFPPFTCQNTEADYEGTVKFPPIGDPMGPHDIMYFKICKGDSNEYHNYLGQFVLQLAIELASKDITVEKNQLLLQSIVCGRLNLFVQVHPNYKESLRDYWSGWRKQPEIAESFIRIIDLELSRYAGLPNVELITPINLINDFKNLSLFSIINYIKDLKIDLLDNEFTNGIIKDVKALSDNIINSVHNLINNRNTLIQNKLNELLPPLSILDQQYASIKKSLFQVENIKPQIGCFIQKDKVIESILSQINIAVENYNDPNILINRIEPKVFLDKQLLLIEINFDISIPKYHLTIVGTINGASAISSEHDKIILRNALSSFTINRLYFKDKTTFGDVEIIAEVSIILKKYIDNLNGKLFENPTIINLGWGETYSLKLKELIQDPNSELIGDEIQVSRFVKNVCIRVNELGITSLIELTNTEIVTTITENQLEKNVSLIEVQKSFNQLTDSLDVIWNNLFEPITSKDLINVNLSKIELSNILNEILSKPIILKQNFAIPAFHFDQKIEAKSSDIDCQNVRTNFDYHDFSYPDFGGWDCMRDLGLLGKHEDPFCVANRESARIAHDAARETARSLYNLERESKRLSHQAENEGKVSACNIAKEVTGFLAVGSFHGNVSSNGNSNINFKSFKFREDLSKIELDFSGEIKSTIQSNLNISPVDLGYVFLCFSNYSKNTNSDLTIQLPERTSTLNLSTLKDGDNLNLIMKLEAIDFDASINPSPLHSLLLDPSLYAICPSFVALLGLAAGVAASIAPFLAMVNQLPTLTPEQVLLLRGSAKGKYEIQEFKIPIKPIEFKIDEANPNESKMSSQINWNAKSIQFITLKP